MLAIGVALADSGRNKRGRLIVLIGSDALPMTPSVAHSNQPGRALGNWRGLSCGLIRTGSLRRRYADRQHYRADDSGERAGFGDRQH